MKLFQTEQYQRIAAMDATLFRDDHPIEDWADNVWWIGIEGGKDVAYCGIKRLDEDIAYLSRAGVLASHQGKGLQKKMIRKRLDWAKAAGCRWVITDTVHDNPASVNSLISLGFRQFIPQYQWKDGALTLYWRKEL